MKTFLRIILALVAIGVVALAAIIFVPPSLTKPDDNLADDWEPAAGEGQYVTQMADCQACHTAEGGEPFAGGRPIESPMGTSEVLAARTHGISSRGSVWRRRRQRAAW